ncbi:globin domain-containing protein [Larkinella terrae]|uniref:Hemoglobin n=1 Tax=Larkinella terrae TaxID=2025311 RepID=A0A7K0ESJ8_9BACT|nr:globin domain-containing protein [Larkinella terrae]MRS64749.1 hemoglobin [Larkinella terrae]
MKEEEIRLVKRSWQILRKIDPILLGDVFYSRLFIDAPGLRPMFAARMDGQYRKLVDMLDAMVANLDKTEVLVAELGELGRRHIGYGVKSQHYDLVGKALLWTLEVALGNDWNSTLKTAWKQCYQEISKAMQQPSR